MKQIKSKEEFMELYYMGKMKYLLWKDKINPNNPKIGDSLGHTKDFSIIVDYDENGFTIHDYCHINSDIQPKKVVKLEFNNINFVRWDLFVLTEKEGRRYYKKLLAYNIQKERSII
jgi:hypothetical protein